MEGNFESGPPLSGDQRRGNHITIADAPPRRPRTAWAWTVTTVAILLSLTISLHSFLPGSLATLTATALPWLGWFLPLLGIGAILTRLKRVWIMVLLPTLIWCVMVGSVLIPLDSGSAAVDPEQVLTVASHNVKGGSGSAAQSARDLSAEGAEIIALVELDANDREAASEELAASHPYSYMVGTVGLWSAYPIELEQPLTLGLGWRRALSADVKTPSGPVSVYVIHAASFRPGDQEDRDSMLQHLGKLLPQDSNERIVVMGDFNATTFDPAMSAILDTVTAPHQSTPSWGFTWPAGFAVARIDHILQRGFTPLENRVFSAGRSDHRANLMTLQ